MLTDKKQLKIYQKYACRIRDLINNCHNCRTSYCAETCYEETEAEIFNIIDEIYNEGWAFYDNYTKMTSPHSGGIDE